MSSRERYVPRAIRGNVYGGLGVGDILDMPRCRIIRDTAQSIPNATPTAISFTALSYDTDGFSTSSSSSRVYVRTSGIYDTKAQIVWTGSAGGILRYAYLLKNGVEQRGSSTMSPGGANNVCNNISTTLTMDAGDYVELFVYQDSGGALATSLSLGAYSAEIMLTLSSTL